MEIVVVILPVAFLLAVGLLLFWAAIKIVNQYERLLVFTLGRTSPDEVKGPGWVFVVPILQRGVRVDLREQFIEVPSQTSITKDNAPISIDFLIYWRIVDPYKSVIEVQNFDGALQNIATTTLRAVVGDILLDDVLSKREQINEVLRVKLDEVTERWGGKVTTVEIREITPPRDVQDAMNRQLSAERTRRAVITESEGSSAVGDQRRRGHQAGRDPASRGRPPGGDPAGRGVRARPRADLRRRVAGGPEDDGAPVPRGVQGARCQPVDEVHPAARDHRPGGQLPRVPGRIERGAAEGRLSVGRLRRPGRRPRRTTPCPDTWRRAGIGRRRRARARAIVAPVDPDRRQPESLGRHVIVEQALGDVHDPVASAGRAARMRHGSSRSFGLYDPTCCAVTTQSNSTPSRRFDAANRSSSQLVRTPSRNRRLSRRSASAESGNAGHASTDREKVATSSPVGSNPSSAPTPRSPAASTVSVRPVRAGLGGRLVSGVAGQHVLGVVPHAVGVEDGLEGRGQPRLPVDQRPVAVEGQGLDVGEVDRRHPRNCSRTATVRNGMPRLVNLIVLVRGGRDDARRVRCRRRRIRIGRSLRPSCRRSGDDRGRCGGPGDRP